MEAENEASKIISNDKRMMTDEFLCKKYTFYEKQITDNGEVKDNIYQACNPMPSGTMASPDFIDTVLGIGSDLNNQVFARAFDDFGKRYFGTNGLEFSNAKLIYMLYSAILTLPLTHKLGQHKIDTLMVVKKDQDLNLAISYATNDGSLSLKIIRFDGSFPPRLSTIEKSVIFELKRVSFSICKKYWLLSRKGNSNLVNWTTPFKNFTMSRFNIELIERLSTLYQKYQEYHTMLAISCEDSTISQSS
uniref:Uncharacterized protein n=1 Tax=Romanomermis culicivorax TaxID=13658 RepID=A0A915J471_ROMCU